MELWRVNKPFISGLIESVDDVEDLMANKEIISININYYGTFLT